MRASGSLDSEKVIEHFKNPRNVGKIEIFIIKDLYLSAQGDPTVVFRGGLWNLARSP